MRQSPLEFLMEAAKELANLSWPPSTAVLKNTAVVVGLLAVVILLLLALDVLVSSGLDLLTS